MKTFFYVVVPLQQPKDTTNFFRFAVRGIKPRKLLEKELKQLQEKDARFVGDLHISRTVKDRAPYPPPDDFQEVFMYPEVDYGLLARVDFV